jgi:hypothetical protein
MRITFINFPQAGTKQTQRSNVQLVNIFLPLCCPTKYIRDVATTPKRKSAVIPLFGSHFTDAFRFSPLYRRYFLTPQKSWKLPWSATASYDCSSIEVRHVLARVHADLYFGHSKRATTSTICVLQEFAPYSDKKINLIVKTVQMA